MKTYSQKEIYKVVSDFYHNKELTPSEFSNRLFAMERIVFRGDSMRDIIDFLEIREHWWEYEKECRARLKSKTRSQFKSMLKKLDLELTKDGLKDLSKEQLI